MNKQTTSEIPAVKSCSQSSCSCSGGKKDTALQAKPTSQPTTRPTSQPTAEQTARALVQDLAARTSLSGGGCQSCSSSSCGSCSSFSSNLTLDLSPISVEQKIRMITGKTSEPAASSRLYSARQRSQALQLMNQQPADTSDLLFPDLGDLTQWQPPEPGMVPEELAGLGRREFLRQLLLGAVGGVGLLAGVSCTQEERAAWTQQHYLRLSPRDRKEVMARLEKQYWQQYKKQVRVRDTPPLPGVRFGYALDLSKCTGCRECVYACSEENNLSRDPQVHWIKVLQLESKHGLNFEKATPYYDPKVVPQDGHSYIPTACQQCDDAPCVRACPVGATWKTPDGIVVVDYNWCIGCRYCMAACPYDARKFNWAPPTIPASQLNTDTHYLGNRPRPEGVVDKCTFCIQRARNKKYPACVEACPVGARKFGDLNDPNGELQYILKNKRILVWKAELHTQPKFFYYY